MAVLVDTNVLLDILTADPHWLAWSSSELRNARATSTLIINPIICAEIAPKFGFDWKAIDQWLQPSSIAKENLPFEASVIAAAAHDQYRKRGGAKLTAMPDFFIGAHAVVAGHVILTRDANRYRTYFPTVTLIAP